MEGIDPDAMMMLESYHWPGNVRELENVMERAVVLAYDAVVPIDVLPEHLLQASGIRLNRTNGGPLPPDASLFVYGTDRGWGARGGKPFALQRLLWNGQTPFEVHEMRAKPDGFELTFTHPVDAATASFQQKGRQALLHVARALAAGRTKVEAAILQLLHRRPQLGRNLRHAGGVHEQGYIVDTRFHEGGAVPSRLRNRLQNAVVIRV